MAKVGDVVYKITEAQANCFKTAFGIFDTDGDGYVTLEEFAKLFRSVGQSPSEATLRKIAEKFDPEGSGKLGLHTFLSICESEFFEESMKEEKLLECFRVFDQDAIGKIKTTELRFILQQIGEPLSDDEADKFIEWALKVPEAVSDGGMINYDVLARELLNRDPDVL
ncbi:calmodulin, putative [Eimeria tenella]|uniref:Calmodulin n=1 Tax=Eimeria tenella TaxID=5802 RepID=U6L515_EIMTE|nr:calmodulin, putative [Eimeria tenella]CDJ42870.1 calmodulin, putative [Eimeria tenella]|eukprot:XP_013233620.1 calmodulin, putative [Eimeria tenella]